LTSNGSGSAAGGESLLDATSFFDGVLHAARDLRLDGEYHGELHCDGRLTIAETARVFGQVRAATIALAGALEGEIDCADRLELLPTARASGRVVAGTVIVHPGAAYEGEMRMRHEPPGLVPREHTERPIAWPASPRAEQPPATADDDSSRAE
jgi:cytoskeletal protein CcmA (bactofilin family)